MTPKILLSIAVAAGALALALVDGGDDEKPARKSEPETPPAPAPKPAAETPPAA